MSSMAGSVGGRTAFQRFASSFGLLSAVVSVAGLLVAVGMTVVPPLLHHHQHTASGPTYLRLKPAAPVRVSLGTGTAVAPVIASSVLPATAVDQPPTDAPLVTWWKGSAKPGAAHGQTVLIGHAAGAAGALGHVADLQKADFVDLLTRQGTMRYRVLSVRSLDPEKYAQVSLDLYKQDGGAGRLVLVSTQQWDGSAYQQDVVVIAAPLGEPS